MTATPERNAAVDAAGWRENLAHLAKVVPEVDNEYTSKARLRHIARMAVGNLAGLYVMLAEAAAVQAQLEEQAQQSEASGLITLDTEIVKP
jgi:hypothetical protein